MGLPDLSSSDQLLVFLGNLFLERTVEACHIVFMLGGDFMIENPLLSLLWETELIRQLIAVSRAFALDLDQCAFGTPWKKPTKLLCSNQLLDVVCVSCPGNHAHEKLQGKSWDSKLALWVFRTKAAQVYPWALCASIAVQVAQIFVDPLAHFAASFALCTPAADRKRPLHSSQPWKGHRQEETARKALSAGYQLKRGAAKPLLEIEMEPGEAVFWMLNVPHPFTRAEPLCADLDIALRRVAQHPAEVVQSREAALAWWSQRAQVLLPLSIQKIMAQPDPALRRLLLGTDDPARAQLGQVCHVALYAEMLRACSSADQALPDLLLHGFPIVGHISPTGRWPPYEKPQKCVPVQDALDRAWDLRKKIIKRVESVPVS